MSIDGRVAQREANTEVCGCIEFPLVHHRDWQYFAHQKWRSALAIVWADVVVVHFRFSVDAAWDATIALPERDESFLSSMCASRLRHRIEPCSLRIRPNSSTSSVPWHSSKFNIRID